MKDSSLPHSYQIRHREAQADRFLWRLSPLEESGWCPIVQVVAHPTDAFELSHQGQPGRPLTCRLFRLVSSDIYGRITGANASSAIALQSEVSRGRAVETDPGRKVLAAPWPKVVPTGGGWPVLLIAGGSPRTNQLVGFGRQEQGPG